MGVGAGHIAARSLSPVCIPSHAITSRRGNNFGTGSSWHNYCLYVCLYCISHQSDGSRVRAARCPLSPATRPDPELQPIMQAVAGLGHGKPEVGDSLKGMDQIMEDKQCCRSWGSALFALPVALHGTSEAQSPLRRLGGFQRNPACISSELHSTIVKLAP